MRILIVDDAAITRLLLTNMLCELGHEVLGDAVDGLDAVVKCKTLMPEVVFLDITMPGMDGLTAIPKLLKHDPAVKIVICSALAQRNIVVEAIQKGAVNYIVKPFQKETLDRVMKEVQGLA